MNAAFAARLPFYYGWVVVGVVFVTMGIGVNVRTAFSLIYPPILAEFGWDRALTAGAFSFGFLVSAGLSPLLGRMMDVRGPRAVTLLGIATTAAGLLLAARASSPWHVYLTFGALIGIGSVCLGYTCQALFLPAWFVRRRGYAMSIAFAGVGIGSIVLLPALQVAIERFGWRAACSGLGLVALILLTPLAFLLRRRPEDVGLPPDGERLEPDAAIAARRSNIVDPAWASIDWTLGRALRTARFWWLALAYFCGLFSWYQVQVHQTQYLIEIGFDATQAAWALGWVSLVGIPGQIAMGQLSDRIGREIVWTIAAGGFVLAYATLLWLAAAPSMALLVGMVLLQGAVGYGLTSVFGAIPAEIFEGRHYGSIFGTLMVVGLAGAAAGPWFGGLAHDATGDYTIAFVAGIVASTLSAVAIWIAAPRKVRVVAGRVG